MSTREPLAIRGAVVALVAAILNLIVAFGVNLTTEQVGAINAVVGLAATAVVVVWSRGAVTPVDDPRGTSGEPLAADPTDDY